jgi:hypothetical protein
MPTNRIKISQDGSSEELILTLVETGKFANDTAYEGTWYMNTGSFRQSNGRCGYNKYFRVHAPEDHWYYYDPAPNGGRLGIGGWENQVHYDKVRAGLGGSGGERTLAAHVTLYGVKRDANGQLSVASNSGTGTGTLHEEGTSGLKRTLPVKWETVPVSIGERFCTRHSDKSK